MFSILEQVDEETDETEETTRLSSKEVLVKMSVKHSVTVGDGTSQDNIGREITSIESETLRLALISTLCSSVAPEAVDDVVSFTLCCPEVSFRYIWNFRCAGGIYTFTWVQKGYPLPHYRDPH